MKTDACKAVKNVVNHDNVQPQDYGEKLGSFKNLWRQRNVTLYAHASAPDKVISIGDNFDGLTRIICCENRTDYRRQLIFGDWSGFQ